MKDKREVIDLRWLAKGLDDPHAVYASLSREELIMADLSDDELANKVFMETGVSRLEEAGRIMRGEPTSLMMLAAAKERIRWLSRQLAITQGRYVPEAKDKLDRDGGKKGEWE